jgi:hypothetical protein
VHRARYAGRHASASPATGIAKRHTLEQGRWWPMRWAFRPVRNPPQEEGLILPQPHPLKDRKIIMSTEVKVPTSVNR